MNLEAIQDFRFEPVSHTYTRRDTMLYALGLGYGSDPLDPSQLNFVYEADLRAVPSICCVLAHPGFWAKRPELGIDWVRLLHGEQSFEIHSPIPAEGTVTARYEISAVVDKGAGKGAILHLVKTLSDANAKLATVRSVLFLRGDGGCGSFGAVPAEVAPLSEGFPSQTSQITTLPQSALIYRLSGDYNPIHADPAAAAKAGFERPILHGLCTLGIATRAALATFADGMPERLGSLSARFSKPVFPGETIRTEFFAMGHQIRFRARALERDVVVLDRGAITLRQ
ncbi:MaoC family dehydratase N-terminal domain-containing protein [Bradyrhizobium sp. CCGUVB1N3]|uniref:MaoC/PaaZ C-terminal domain-containing protein n=1 Tax=Bradyrhizobium sp. CCGUVB1N3 TaxID=2949629 RepID=UPI0020B1CD96|nr:MaoC/PaaZ C-terminal domain-containing protein [Bradyrhizobium sp. CCGUVB1N3]MCP3468708.1 MaoC family dehydratase N-terminal domain-containing protein [Bradyrhizobium sp. CCGUVB1N3]